MNKTKKILSLTIGSIVILSMVGCSRTVTGNKDSDAALTSFNSIVKQYPENKGFHQALQHWGFKLPTGEKFEWTKDTSANKADFAMVMLADPLVKAGLNIDKLDKNEWLYSPAETENGVQLPNRLIKPYNVSDKKQTSNGSEDALRRLLKVNSKLISPVVDEKHFMLMLGDGYEVHWAEKLGATDEDMEFVLNADVLTKAGLDISKLDGSGWKLEKAETNNMNGADSKINVIVKGFKLKS